MRWPAIVRPPVGKSRSISRLTCLQAGTQASNPACRIACLIHRKSMCTLCLIKDIELNRSAVGMASRFLLSTRVCQMMIRSISSRLTVSLVRSYSLVVRADSWQAMR